MIFFRKHVIWTNILICVIEVGLAVIIWLSGEWFFAGSVETFGPLNNYGFIWLSIVIATIAAINAIFASIMASETQRPFVAMPDDDISIKREKDNIFIPYSIKNFGNLPAQDVELEMQFFVTGENISKDNVSKTYPKLQLLSKLPIIFPNNSYQAEYIIKNELNSELLTNIAEGNVSFRLRIKYNGLGKKHITIQTIQISKKEYHEGLGIIPVYPQIYK
jgi:hypothetical protein